MSRAKSLVLPFLILSFWGATQTSFASVIDFESYSGPSVYGSTNAQTLTISTGIGNVTISGGVVLTNASNLPADETSVYGTASFATGTGYSNTITVTFPQAINNFFLDVVNGETSSVTYQLADNAGHSASFTLASNASSGKQTVGFAATGTVVTITASTQPTTMSIGPSTQAMLVGRSNGLRGGEGPGQGTAAGAVRRPRGNISVTTWDFFIDNIHFNEALPPSLAVPVPPSLLLGLTGLGGAGLYWLKRSMSRRG